MTGTEIAKSECGRVTYPTGSPPLQVRRHFDFTAENQQSKAYLDRGSRPQSVPSSHTPQHASGDNAYHSCRSFAIVYESRQKRTSTNTSERSYGSFVHNFTYLDAYTQTLASQNMLQLTSSASVSPPGRLRAPRPSHYQSRTGRSNHPSTYNPHLNVWCLHMDVGRAVRVDRAIHTTDVAQWQAMRRATSPSIYGNVPP
jgi:hypothetical protein